MEEQAIRNVAEGFLSAWNSHDMAAFAALYAADADFVNVYGAYWKGRDAIEAAHRASHATVFRTSRLSASKVAVRLLGEGAAVAHVFWDLVGLRRPDGVPLPDRRGILVHVLERSADGWRIVATHNTDIVQPPA